MAVDLKRPADISAKSMPAPQQGGTVDHDREIQSIEISKAENGGFVAECRYKPKPTRKNQVSDYEPPKQYAFSSGEELIEFLEDAFGIDDGDEGDE